MYHKMLFVLAFCSGVPFSTAVYATNILIPTDQPTIQAGVNAASSGDTVLVSDGIYIGSSNKNIDFKGKKIILKSKNGPDNCIIDCQNDGSGFYFHSGEIASTKIIGFTIINANNSAIRCILNSSPTIQNCKIQNNTGNPYGGGIYVRQSSPIIIGCLIQNNNATESAGGLYFSNSSSAIMNTKISSNTARNIAAGILSAFSTLTIKSCEISNNAISTTGGGIFSQNSTIYMEYCRIDSNHAHSGGGVYAYPSDNYQIKNTVFNNNSAVQEGGALANIEGGSFVLDRCVFSNNRAGWGAAIHSGAATSLSNINFYNNTATYAGGAVYFNGASGKVMNSTIANNSAQVGGGLFVPSFSSPIILNTIIWNNGDEIYKENGSGLSVSYSDIKNGYSGTGNINALPLFVNPTFGDFHLQANSPCINKGKPLEFSSTDLDGEIRPYGLLSDIGSDEYTGIENKNYIKFSINTHWYNWANDFASYQDLIKSFYLVRDGAWWQSLEFNDFISEIQWTSAEWSYPYSIQLPNCNQTVVYQSGYDELVKKFQFADSPELLLLLDIKNPSINADPNLITYDQYYDYVFHIADRYNGDGVNDMPGLIRPVKYYEVGNEVDNSIYNSGLSAENYALNRLIPAYRAIKAMNPDALVLSSGLFLGGNNGFDGSYLERMLKIVKDNDGSSNSFFTDAIAIHYYYDPQNPEYIIENFGSIKSVLNSFGIGSKPIYITEYGIATKEDAGGLIRQDDQASVIIRYNILKSYLGVVDGLIYELKDSLSADPTNWENVYGIYEVSCENNVEVIDPKLTLKALGNLRTKTADMKFDSINSLQERTSGIYRFSYSNAEKKLQIIWFTAYDGTGINPDYSNEKTSFSIAIGKNTGVVSDMYGNITHPQVSENDIVTLGEGPIYLEYYDIDADSDGDWDIDGRDLVMGIESGILPIEKIAEHFGKSHYLLPF